MKVPIEVTEDYKFKIAITATVGYLVLLVLSAIGALLGGLDIFDKVAAATSGPIGLVWGYYFGTKKKDE